MDSRERAEHTRRAISILTELIAAHPDTPSYQHLLASCYRELRPDRPGPFVEPASDPRTQAVEILEQLVADYPGVPDYRFDLGETYAIILEGEVCQALGHGYVFDLSERGYRLLSNVLSRLGEHEFADDARERAGESRRARQRWHDSAGSRPR
jgi:hypothetical protein